MTPISVRDHRRRVRQRDRWRSSRRSPSFAALGVLRLRWCHPRCGPGRTRGSSPRATVLVRARNRRSRATSRRPPPWSRGRSSWCSSVRSAGTSAASGVTVILAYVLAAMLPAPIGDVWAREAGWIVGVAVAGLGALVCWPVQERQRVRDASADLADALADAADEVNPTTAVAAAHARSARREHRRRVPPGGERGAGTVLVCPRWSASCDWRYDFVTEFPDSCSRLQDRTLSSPRAATMIPDRLPDALLRLLPDTVAVSELVRVRAWSHRPARYRGRGEAGSRSLYLPPVCFLRLRRRVPGARCSSCCSLAVAVRHRHEPRVHTLSPAPTRPAPFRARRSPLPRGAGRLPRRQCASSPITGASTRCAWRAAAPAP